MCLGTTREPPTKVGRGEATNAPISQCNSHRSRKTIVTGVGGRRSRSNLTIYKGQKEEDRQRTSRARSNTRGYDIRTRSSYPVHCLGINHRNSGFCGTGRTFTQQTRQRTPQRGLTSFCTSKRKHHERRFVIILELANWQRKKGFIRAMRSCFEEPPSLSGSTYIVGTYVMQVRTGIRAE